jgi:hypothetical protein
MANATAGFGLKPVSRSNGAPWTGEPVRALIASGVATAQFIGDPVLALGAGNTSELTHVGSGKQIPGALPTVTIAVAGATNKIYGVIVGFDMIHRDSTIYREASTDRIALIAPAWDPNIVFRLRDDGSGVIGTALVGANANLVAGGGGSTVTGRSSWMLDATTPTNDATYQCTILRAANIFDNDPTLASAVWDVQINLPQPFPGIVGFA